ncbi:MAG: Tat pathway signal protein [Mesorhizobium sp.]|nr:MAG: Tat pathway signal protein [Mesorhizobium sp.]
MISRRSILIAGGAAAIAGGGALMLNRGPDYDAATAALWSHRDPAEFMGLVHYTTLAANSHNAQAWRFRRTTEGVAILPDMARALPVADSDHHHLYASLGCAAENLMLAAGAAGRSSAMEFATDGEARIEIALGQVGNRDGLFDAILERQCTRSDFSGRPVPRSDLSAMQVAARVAGCELLLIEDRAKIEQVLELILAANATQVSDPAFAEELGSWLRFNARAAIEMGDGLYSGCSGNPSLPTFLGRIMFGVFFKPDAENDRYARQVRSSSGLAVFVSERDDPAHWVRAGRSYQRFALQATALGIRHAHLNQPIEVPSVRRELQSLLGLGNRRPDLVLRFGYAQPMPRSLRRPVRSVIAP